MDLHVSVNFYFSGVLIERVLLLTCFGLVACSIGLVDLGGRFVVSHKLAPKLFIS